MTDRETIIENLKRLYGVETEQAVLQRALEIALAAAKYANANGGGGSPVQIYADGFVDGARIR